MPLQLIRRVCKQTSKLELFDAIVERHPTAQCEDRDGHANMDDVSPKGAQLVHTTLYVSQQAKERRASDDDVMA